MISQQVEPGSTDVGSRPASIDRIHKQRQTTHLVADLAFVLEAVEAVFAVEAPDHILRVLDLSVPEFAGGPRVGDVVASLA